MKYLSAALIAALFTLASCRSSAPTAPVQQGGGMVMPTK